MTFARFDRYVDRHARTFTERLQALCRMPSVAARGTGVRATAEAVEQMMQRVGIGTQAFKMGAGYPILYGECGSGPRTFLVYGHYDVQPVGHLTDWSVGPFAATINEGKLYARGAANSKGDLIARLAAVEAYQKSFGKLPVSLRFIVEGEDGLGSPSLYRFTTQHSDLLAADGCIWDEGHRDGRGRLVISLGFKGITFLELRAHGARSGIEAQRPHARQQPLAADLDLHLAAHLARHGDAGIGILGEQVELGFVELDLRVGARDLDHAADRRARRRRAACARRRRPPAGGSRRSRGRGSSCVRPGDRSSRRSRRRMTAACRTSPDRTRSGSDARRSSSPARHG